MEEISTLELRELMKSSSQFTLLDCRAADYYHWERLPGAKNLRWKKIADAALDKLPDKNSLVITHCQSFLCPASVKGYEALVSRGYKNIIEYSGGVEDWKAHGFATESTLQFKIAPNVYRFPNQTFYGEQVGSYVIEEEEFVLLFDGPMQLTEENEDFILGFGKPIKVLLSHGPTAGGTATLQKKHKAEIYLHAADASNQWLTVKPDVLFESAPNLGKNLKVVAMPGHSPGSVALFDSRNRILFTGDAVGGMPSGSVHDFVRHDRSDDVAERMRSVISILTLDFDTIYPFHYSPIVQNAKSSLRKFIESKKGEL
jgi:glyoxylase-like metal-dependent hydrolase (beta-lactamase superfamily II)/rhodanese-related sulfurtransferase